MKALTKEKKDNVLIDLKLVNMKNTFILNSKKLKRKTSKAKKKS